MGRFTQLDGTCLCPHRHACPHLDGLPARLVLRRYQAAGGLEERYERQIQDLQEQRDQANRRIEELEQEVQQLQAQNQALHRRQFKGHVLFG